METSDFIAASVAAARLTRLGSHLSVIDRGRLDQLVGLLGTERQVTVAAFRDVVFAGKSDAAVTKAIERLIDNLADAVSAADDDLAVEVRGPKRAGAAGRSIGFTARLVERSGAPFTELRAQEGRLITGRQAMLLTEPRLRLPVDQATGKQVVRVFLSYAHADKSEVDRLWNLLGQATRVSSRYRFELWRETEQVLVSEMWDAQIKSALGQAELGIFAISNAFLGSEYITEVELPAFVDGSASVAGKRAIPVLLDPIDFGNTDLKGLAERQIFRDRGPFSRAGQRRLEWVQELVAQIHRVLDRYGDAVGEGLGGDSPTGGTAATQTADVDTEGLSSEGEIAIDDPAERGERWMGLGDYRQLGAKFFPTQGRLGGVAVDASERARDSEVAEVAEGQRVDALEHLMTWVAAEERSLAAVLGEYGMGKTITCQAFADALLARRAAGEQLPEPLYFDLRNLANLGQTHTVPTLEAIIDEVVDRSWAASGAAKPTAVELLADARRHPTVFVFDGLDEALVHLNESQGVAFTRELLKLRPQRRADGQIAAPHGGVHTKVLVSCRTNYFRTLRDQSRHFAEQQRDRSSVDDYAALVLLPLTPEQIRQYLTHAVPERNVNQLVEMLAAVHDLSELTRRPYTLARVAEQIPLIERKRMHGEPVYSSTIYEQMVLDWLTRDEGKHQLKAEHKLGLMARLAAWSWARGGRLIESADLEDWLHEQLAEPAMARRYGGFDRDKLEEDLRTATFVVREDTERGSGFRFAHSSIQEFFLARYLFDALAANRRAEWCLPLPSDETLEFLGQLIANHADPAALIVTMQGWRAPYLAQASELVLDYARYARAEGWPTPSLARIDLSGADLRRWKFTGSIGGGSASSGGGERVGPERLNMVGATLRGADLRSTDWSHVDLSRADFTGARLDRAVFDGVRAVSARLDGAAAQGAYVRDSRFDDASIDATDLGALRQVRTPLPSRGDLGLPPEVVTRLETLTGHTSSVVACAFSPDGHHLVTASTDQTTRVWDTTTWELVETLTGHTSGVVACAFSPDGHHLVTASDDQTVRAWDTTTWEPVETLTGHTGGVWACAFSPDGHHLATASADQTVRVWDTTTWEPATLLAHAAGGQASWSLADQRLLSASDNAWRWLRVTCRDITTRRWLGSYPYELAYPTLGLPVVGSAV